MITVISVGGSIIVPDKIDISFIKRLRSLLKTHTAKGNKVVIVCGGGKTARNYQEAAKKTIKLKQKDLDWIGIHATHLNAVLVNHVLKDLTGPDIVINPTKKVKFSKKVLVAAGWKPGCSTDYDAVLLAKQVKARQIINMTNVDQVYDKDPRKYKTAKPVKKITWKQFRKLVGSKWKPGLNMPFDPIASKEAAKHKLKVIIVGNSLLNLKKVLQNKPFKGTVIK